MSLFDSGKNEEIVQMSIDFQFDDLTINLAKGDLHYEVSSSNLILKMNQTEKTMTVKIELHEFAVLA